MRFPHGSSNAQKIATVIFKNGPVTLEQGIDHHGIMNGERRKTRAVYQNAIDCGWLEEKEGRYYITAPLMHHMIGCRKTEPAVSNIAPPRLVNMWTKEMSTDAAQRKKFGAA